MLSVKAIQTMKWQQRFTQIALSLNEAMPPLVITNLNNWTSISITGEESKSYLQGQLTCDVVKLDEHESTLAAHCDAKGKVWSIFRLFKHNDGYSLLLNASTVENSLKEIKKYSVFSKVKIEQSSNVALGVIGSQATQFIDSLSEVRGNVRPLGYGSAVKISHQRWLLLINEDSVETLLEKPTNALFSDTSIWDMCDIHEGIPRITEEIQNSQIPQAFNLQSLGAISFSKGCYTGQETVARAKYRGTNKRAMYKVMGQLSAGAESNWQLERSVGDNWRAAGTIFTHYQYSNGTVIGLVILPNNLEAEAQLRLADHTGSHWSIEPLPYSIEES